MVRNPLRLEYELCLGTGSSFGYSKRPTMIHHKHRWEIHVQVPSHLEFCSERQGEETGSLGRMSDSERQWA